MGRIKGSRIFAGVLVLLVGLPALAYAGLVVINWNDEAPSAEARQLAAIYRDRPAVADADNGLVHLQALAEEAGAGYRAARSAEVAALVDACSEAAACAEKLDADPEAFGQWLQTELGLLDGYRRMLAATGWSEEVPEDPVARLPSYQPAMDAQKLHLLDARRLALAGDAVAARDLLDRDLVFWRGVMASSDMLLTKMVAVAAAERNFEFGNLALAGLPPEQIAQAVPPSWRAPLTVAERSLFRAFGGEWRFTVGAMQQIHAGMQDEDQGRPGGRLSRPLLQEQATLNLAAASMVRLGRLSELPHAELGPALALLGEEPAPPAFRLYNPVGSILQSLAPASLYSHYIARVSDLEGHRRAALLVAGLRGGGIGVDEAAAAVRDSPLRNPYDGSALEWDAASRSVVFNGLEAGERGRHAVLL
ncbi:hypothetical protein LY625_09800 [Lysobacter sp. GX 14042]|uniref:hypothetical protein n=1 Tax=Lysobacter sp. GX 14042 TaxID=2907155 RepID=UPI001F3F778B|nr:hypothetical protein [Lysobacter sp. GX 14042]MCE7032901.1 hypothetical protein [Lysobacter sp. GX 14042]